ncbi:GlxA family transcriptional regulator [Shimia sp. MMG029]|uniref:GlxA family transcriptional regulator n=1 Tax=Shimia sp. MMG029 TaxID=3021978 RepID=UPI0022FDD26E|nr:helix-turn-helix domain-containing protein [Shimia sp. MMG029]MDA5557591.1 helix-turn-helix domain-containing protein [Shimia sp. MMG029]
MPNAPTVILAYPGALQSAVLGLNDFFTHTDLHPKIVSNGDDLPRSPAAILLPPAAEQVAPEDHPELVSYLQRSAAAGSLICSACVGVSWIAAAGIDFGRTVTTHWGVAPQLRKTWPHLQIDTDRLVIEHQNLVTAGGMMAWVDLALIVIERLAGHEVMLNTARHFIVDPVRRDQRRFQRFQPNVDHGDQQILRAQHELERALQETLSVAQLAEVAGVSPRSLQRRFTAATGFTLTQYMQKLRIERAKSLLADSRLPVAEVAAQSGYRDLPAFHRVFSRITGMTPTSFRKSVWSQGT